MHFMSQIYRSPVVNHTVATLNVKVKMAPKTKSKWLLLISIGAKILRTMSHFMLRVTEHPYQAPHLLPVGLFQESRYHLQH